MSRVSIIDSQMPGTCIRLRRGTQGPELTMVTQFSEQLKAHYESQGGTSRILLVFEPLIDSGYPDLLAIRYTSTFMRHWQDSRAELTDNDLRLLSCLMSAPLSTNALSSTLGFTMQGLMQSIDSLCGCGLCWSDGEKYHAMRRDRIFGVKRIVSYEAKVQAVSSVFHQALVNTRFSSSSCAIISSKRPTSNTIALFEERGLGLFAACGKTRVVEPRVRNLPKSFVTLKLNELVARCIARGVIT